MSNNIIPHTYKISRTERQKLHGHSSFLIFFTGLSGSGKSTIANAVEQRLHDNGIHTYTLDGDNIRSGINKNLSFSPEDRTENIRRISEISKLFIDAGLVVLAAFVAPYEKDRKAIRHAVGTENYVEVFVNTSLEVCERRDVKGLYAKARRGEISNMTGISAPYETPKSPHVEVTENNSIEESVEMIYKAIEKHLK
ncbi:adenylyl-sulfate kinase [Croceitalea sp. MTPC5]|uniref:adenylyl-sulfate kinase n=1 Tax=Croceitalea sp. MTPC5 TaxID=3056565 RepID=UPI002B369778|nr:adenylyl-sulfate kinase [Croceitalea sp. MTPC5]